MLLLEIEDANARKKKFLNSIPRLGLLDTTMLHDTYVEARPSPFPPTSSLFAMDME